MQCFLVSYGGMLVSSFFLILYTYKSYLSKSVLLSFSAESTFCFFQLTDISIKLCCVIQFFILWFNSFYALYASYFTRTSCFCVSENVFCKLCTLFNFLFNHTIFFSISSNWILAAFIEFSILAWSFLNFIFNQLDFSLSYVFYACKLAFLFSRLKS